MLFAIENFSYQLISPPDLTTFLHHCMLRSYSIAKLFYGMILYFYSIVYRELDNNRITSLPLKVFSDLHSLIHLYLEHNSISKIPLNTFNATVNMQFL